MKKKNTTFQFPIQRKFDSKKITALVDWKATLFKFIFPDISCRSRK